jgi:hypothetical protein
VDPRLTVGSLKSGSIWIKELNERRTVAHHRLEFYGQSSGGSAGPRPDVPADLLVADHLLEEARSARVLPVPPNTPSGILGHPSFLQLSLSSRKTHFTGLPMNRHTTIGLAMRSGRLPTKTTTPSLLPRMSAYIAYIEKATEGRANRGGRGTLCPPLYLMYDWLMHCTLALPVSPGKVAAALVC